MKENNTPQMTTLDQMVNDDSLQMMKAAIPYVSPNGRKTLSLLTKFMELRKTMSMFSQPHMDMSIMSSEETTVSPEEMLRDIQQYTSGSLHDSIEGMLSAFQTAQMFMMFQNMEEDE